MNQIKPTDEQMAAARKFISDWCRDGRYVTTHDVARLLAEREAPLRAQVAELTEVLWMVRAYMHALQRNLSRSTLAEATAKVKP